MRGFAADHGRELEPPRFVTQEMIDRLLRPMGGAALARRLDLLLALSSHLTAEPLPCSLRDAGEPELERVLLRTMAHWAQRTGWAPSRDAVPA